jgi:hypothetical protein
MPRSKKNFYYAILSLQPSLMDKRTTIPLGLIVISPADQKVIVFGRDLTEQEARGRINAKMLEKWKSTLPDQLIASLQASLDAEHPNHEFFRHLASSHRWNLFLSTTKMVEADVVEDEAYSLFCKFVLKQTPDDFVRQEQEGLGNIEVSKHSFYQMQGKLPKNQHLVTA